MAAPVGPSIERGKVSDFKPAPLPHPPGPKEGEELSEAEQRELAKSTLGLDEEQMTALEAPVITADAVVRLTEVGTYMVCRFRSVGRRRPWDSEKAEAARFTPGAREDVKAFAPFALPYLQQTAAANPWLGLGLFGMVVWNVAGDSLSRVSEIERRRGEDAPKPKAPPRQVEAETVEPQRTAGPPIVR